MAITMRKGLFADFDPSKMLAGEWAVSIDADTQHQIVWMCFGAGIVKRMGTLEDFEAWLSEAMIPYTQAFDQIKAECTDLRDEILLIYDALIPAKEIVERMPELVAQCEQAVDDCEAIKDAIDDAVQFNIPQFSVDFATGELIYTGGRFDFSINRATGQLEWAIA